ncbi:hypothetical protein [Allomuricauda sp. SCSIO 65647]|uniref:hypothetical protein n=1 Tax=Allomuricauda sp. SCSIO 65647 TaxID=2908843 RepID=UPI001F30A258|nr:hypothetical protein [Muricauda sp. SCSIO 65647]UJH68451.1 hypothetical protein L0P89_04395 [Muricauda sp. SCSIO 65647]
MYLESGLELLQKAQTKQLYQGLVEQLKKDFVLAGIDFKLSSSVKPQDLLLLLKEKLYVLLLEHFDDYLNLLYVVDVPEKEFKKIDSDDIVKVAEGVAFLVLKREWQKVWSRSSFGQD